jgi:hypothetical protein
MFHGFEVSNWGLEDVFWKKQGFNYRPIMECSMAIATKFQGLRGVSCF